MNNIKLENTLSVIVIPTYNETISLESFLSGLLTKIDSTVSVIVCDDSGPELATFFELLEVQLRKKSKNLIFFDYCQSKSGRGAAVIRGIALANKKFPNLLNCVECDADESHRVDDVISVLKLGQTTDFVIGSRYLNESQIIGWPLSRRIFSRILNKVIPGILNLKLTDATNGLRSYSRETIDILLSHKFMNSGFIMLSEEAALLKRNQVEPVEVPTVFVNRKLGKSTVTYREILKSLTGLLKLISRYKFSRG
jgi:dolichol-phosphate mannosyltransferase